MLYVVDSCLSCYQLHLTKFGVLILKFVFVHHIQFFSYEAVYVFKIVINYWNNVCGQFNALNQRRNFTQRLKTAYKHYFGCQVGDQDKSWTPHVFCTACYSGLTQWLNGKQNNMPFASLPIVWREPTNYYADCYFCMTNSKGDGKQISEEVQS